jgi:two-component system, cell cycle response regulator
MRILIAEDDVTSRVVLSSMLRKNGHEVVETANGTQAWDVLRQKQSPSLAILDWMMPEMDGLDVIRNVRNLQTDIPAYIIILSGKGEKADIIAGLAAGADDYIAKPFDPGELSARIDVGRRLIEMQSRLNEARLALAHEATHDPLTGTLNRRAILDTLSREISREKRNPVGLTVGICDIDHFKTVNDNYGHLVGDEVLYGFVRLLQGKLREYDILGRFGGEEFVVVTPGLGGDDAAALYARFIEAVAENPIPTQAGNVSITISIGVATWKHDEKMDALLTAADTALYRAKNEGRNRVRVSNGP